MSAYRRMLVGYDPGRDAGLALLDDRGGQRPELVQLWEIHGDDHLWHARLASAVTECAGLLRGAAEAAPEGWREPLVWAEDWVPYARADRPRQQAWIGLGRRQGAFLAAWVAEAGALPTLVPPGDESVQHLGDRARQGWTRLLGVAAGKLEADGGRHRLAEAARYVDGPVRDRLLACGSRGRQVDLAEAILIAAAAGVHGRALARTGRAA